MSEYRHSFKSGQVQMKDASGPAFTPRPNDLWAPVLIKSAEIEAEIERLAALPKPANGRRETIFVHPQARSDCPTLAPGIRVTMSVLLPGERTVPFRHNATDVNFCIRGAGRAYTSGREIAFSQYDVWNHPSYATSYFENDGDEIQVRFTYSNAPLLQYMEVYQSDEGDAATYQPVINHGKSAINPRGTSPYGVFEIGDDGAQLMPYERLINPPAVESRALYWPWKRVEAELEKLEALGREYIGRRLYLLYNSMTGRTNGTTPSFFATMTIRPASIVDRPHRHVSAAINYYFRGSGYSMVAGNRYEWAAGDLMLSAPGWAVHNHASHDERVYELTVQDQPLNIAMESLLWQENLKEPPALLGAEVGFNTNRR